MRSKISNLEVLLLLQSINGIGQSSIKKIIKAVKLKFNCDIYDIFNIDKSELKYLLLSLDLNNYQINNILNPNWVFVDKQLNIAKNNNINIISIYDSSYPSLLKEIYDPPYILYIKGNKKILNNSQIAVIGTRNPTIYGKTMAHNFSSDICHSGYIITSGFALGVDITAHLAAANQNIPTIVVLGTSLDNIYPARHNRYVNKILDTGGVFISENYFTTEAHPSIFPKRNRIISGLSKGVLVVEAARKSGSLITARMAMEQGRDVFVIPGNINNSQALGGLDLISDGAKLVTSADNILEELNGFFNQDLRKSTCRSYVNSEASKIEPGFSSAGLSRGTVLDQNDYLDNFGENSDNNQTDLKNSLISKDQEKLLQAISGSVTSFDTIIMNNSLCATTVSSMLVQLEIMGYVKQVPGGYIKVSI